MEESFLITNGPVRSFYNELIENLNSCSQFKISVAFITYGHYRHSWTILNGQDDAKIDPYPYGR